MHVIFSVSPAKERNVCQGQFFKRLVPCFLRLEHGLVESLVFRKIEELLFRNKGEKSKTICWFKKSNNTQTLVRILKCLLSHILSHLNLTTTHCYFYREGTKIYINYMYKYN